MFGFFTKQRDKTTHPAEGQKNPSAANSSWFDPLPVVILLATPKRQKLLTHIWQRTSLSHKQFDELFMQPIRRYAELVQQFPASESHHHAYPGGMLDHGLEIMAYALKLRQSHLLPVGAPPETQAAQSDAWTAGTAYGALLHDIGKIAVDIHVETESGQTWHPWHGPLSQPYRFHYLKHREYRLHNAASGLLYNRILNGYIMDWLSAYPELWSALLYILAGQNEHAGILGELVIKADQASVAQELGGDPTKALSAPKHALQRKLLDGLRFLLKETLKLNQPQASDGWLTDDALWLVSKTVSDKLRAHLLAQGISGIPASNTAVFDVLQEHGIAQPTSEGKAIWSATVTGNNGWSNTFTFLKIAPALIWEKLEDRPAAFNGQVQAQPSNTQTAVANGAPPAQNIPPQAAPIPLPVAIQPDNAAPGDALDSFFSFMGDLGISPDTPEHPSSITLETPSMNQELSPPTDNVIAPENTPTAISDPESPMAVTKPTGQPSGEHFVQWLRYSILERKLIINDAHALVHTVGDTVFIVTPGIFQRYVQEFPTVFQHAKALNLKDWQWAQKQFEYLKLHRKQKNGLNIWTCEVSGPRKTRKVHGYLMKDPALLIPDTVFNNPYLKVISDT